MTVVDRSTSCILGWAVDQERSEETLQKMVDHAPQAAFCHLPSGCLLSGALYTDA